MNLNKRILNRPLTPHLTIYSGQITSIYSIWHRITAVSLILIFFLFFSFLKVSTYGIYKAVEIFTINILWCQNSFFLNLSIFFLYHLLNGVRHITWDLGFNLPIKIILRSTIVLIFILFIYIFYITQSIIR